MLAIGDRVLTIQAHPEFTRSYTGDLLEERGPGIVPDPLLDAARAGLDGPTDNDHIAARIVALFKSAEVPA
jgi:hypothetical protein